LRLKERFFVFFLKQSQDAGGSKELQKLIREANREETLFELTSQDLVTWTPQHVVSWMDALGIGSYRKTFLRHDIDGHALQKLSMNDLKNDLVTKLISQFTNLTPLSNRKSNRSVIETLSSRK
jgi:hypothetical protein